ncbi:MAG: iron-containing alcohol dehydrogenase [Anaerorhabdus sp.]
MYNNFYYKQKTTIFFGEQSIEKIKELSLQGKTLVLYGGNYILKLNIIDNIKSLISEENLIIVSDCPTNPSNIDVEAISNQYKNENIQNIIAIGGGSVIDLAKALSIYYLSDSNSYIDMVKTRNINKSLNLLTITTNPSSGSEVNNTFVITDANTGNKMAMGTDFTYPIATFYDIGHMNTLTIGQISNSTADILSHLLEQYFSSNDTTVFTDNLIISCIDTLITSYNELKNNINNDIAKQNFMLVAGYSLNYYLSIGKTLDWNAHQIEHCISGKYKTPHTIGISIIYPNYLKYACENEIYNKKLLYINTKLFGTDYQQDPTLKLEEIFKSFKLPTKLSDLSDKININEITELMFLEQKEIGKIYKLNPSIVTNILNECM